MDGRAVAVLSTFLRLGMNENRATNACSALARPMENNGNNCWLLALTCSAQLNPAPRASHAPLLAQL